MGGVADHVHLLVSLFKTLSVSDLMLNIKRDSSKWMNSQAAVVAHFEWQEGYFAFSIGESGVDARKTYIAGQKQHHVHVDFKGEVRTLLRKYAVEWDERYVWE